MDIDTFLVNATRGSERGVHCISGTMDNDGSNLITKDGLEEYDEQEVMTVAAAARMGQQFNGESSSIHALHQALLSRQYTQMLQYSQGAGARANEHLHGAQQEDDPTQMMQAFLHHPQIPYHSGAGTSGAMYSNPVPPLDISYYQQGGGTQESAASSLIQRNRAMMDMILSGRQTDPEGRGGPNGFSFSPLADSSFNAASYNTAMMQQQQQQQHNLMGQGFHSASAGFASMLDAAESSAAAEHQLQHDFLQQQLLLQQVLSGGYPQTNNVPASGSAIWQTQQLSSPLPNTARGGEDVQSPDMQRVSASVMKQHSPSGASPHDELVTSKTKALLKKKPKDKPKRPLSAYNIFFKEERQRILHSIPNSNDEPVYKGTNMDEKGLVNDELLGYDKEDGLTTTMEGELFHGATLSTALALRNKRKKNPHGKIGFESLAREIGKRWKELDATSMHYYQKLACVDMNRYKEEMTKFIMKQREASANKLETLKFFADDC